MRDSQGLKRGAAGCQGGPPWWGPGHPGPRSMWDAVTAACTPSPQPLSQPPFPGLRQPSPGSLGLQAIRGLLAAATAKARERRGHSQRMHLSCLVGLSRWGGDAGLQQLLQHPPQELGGGLEIRGQVAPGAAGITRILLLCPRKVVETFKIRILRLAFRAQPTFLIRFLLTLSYFSPLSWGP